MKNLSNTINIFGRTIAGVLTFKKVLSQSSVGKKGLKKLLMNILIKFISSNDFQRLLCTGLMLLEETCLAKYEAHTCLDKYGLS